MALSRPPPVPIPGVGFVEQVGSVPPVSSTTPFRRTVSTSEAVLEEELRRECAELEEQLRQEKDEAQEEPEHDWGVHNETLEVQLVQLQDDFEYLKKDFTSMCGFMQKQLADKKDQLEEQARAASDAEGRAESLHEVLHFHEENGQLINSYWRAQCEKRDDSIRFLTLKLQEYTVPSAEYRARRQVAPDPSATLPADSATPSSSSTAPVSPKGASARADEASSGPAPSTAQLYQTLLEQHQMLCREYHEQEDANSALVQALEASELRQSALEARIRHSMNCQRTQENSRQEDARHVAALEASLEAECARLRSELEACEQAFASASTPVASPGNRGKLPAWAHRCVWRDELDVRAGQLERISLQLDATKRSLDAANEELQWQATSAEALRMRLEDVLRSIQVEEAKSRDLREAFLRSQSQVEELLRHWPPREMTGPGRGAEATDGQYLPLLCQQAYWLLDTSRRGGNAPRATRAEQADAIGSNIHAAQKRIPEAVLEAQSGSIRLAI